MLSKCCSWPIKIYKKNKVCSNCLKEIKKENKLNKKMFYRIWLSFTIVSHHIAIWIVLASVLMLFINEPIWISLPLSTWIMHLGLNRLDCPYTRLENYLRRKLGLQEITTFISHYYKKPYHKMMWEWKKITGKR